MKIKEKTFSDQGQSNYDYRSFLGIEVNGEDRVYLLDGEPEDANLSRDFSDCFRITALMHEAYKAGVHGEVFEIEEISVDHPE